MDLYLTNTKKNRKDENGAGKKIVGPSKLKIFSECEWHYKLFSWLQIIQLTYNTILIMAYILPNIKCQIYCQRLLLLCHINVRMSTSNFLGLCCVWISQTDRQRYYYIDSDPDLGITNYKCEIGYEWRWWLLLIRNHEIMLLFI